MHNLTKIKLFSILLWIVYPFALLLLYPFALLKRKKHSSLFFFYDRYAIGGAQRVYLDILESVKDTPKTVYFTRYSLKTAIPFSPPNFAGSILYGMMLRMRNGSLAISYFLLGEHENRC